jgi:hypothetical protein
METVAPSSSRDLRLAIYRGRFFKLDATQATRAIVARTRRIMNEVFSEPADLQSVQAELPAEEFKKGLAEIGTRINREVDDYVQIMRTMLRERGFDPAQHGLAPPILRAAGGNLPSDPQAYFAHRDTWYGNSYSQINWCVALFDIALEQSFAFHPDFFDNPVKNDSECFDYDDFIRRAGADKYQGELVYPRALEMSEIGQPHRFSLQAGQVLLFSGAHLHRTMPNTLGKTRFSLDFRSVCLREHDEGVGAPNVDGRCTGSVLIHYVKPEAPSTAP